MYVASVFLGFLLFGIAVSTDCDIYEFQCDGLCKNQTTWCDGEQDCSDGSDEAHCATMVCTNKTDIVFVVDSSGSIQDNDPEDGSYKNYDLLKEFVSNVIGLLDISEDKIHVGLVRFSHFANSEFYLNDTFIKSEQQDLVLNMGYIGGLTNTSGALKEMMQNQFKEASGDRTNVPNIAIVITDGGSSLEPEQTIPAAEAAHAAGIKIISVGITNRINMTELVGISSPPHKEGVNYFISQDFLSLDVDVKDVLIMETCSVTNEEAEMPMDSTLKWSETQTQTQPETVEETTQLSSYVTSDNTVSPAGGRLSTAAIAGIAVGSILFLIIITTVVIVACCRFHKMSKELEELKKNQDGFTNPEFTVSEQEIVYDKIDDGDYLHPVPHNDKPLALANQGPGQYQSLKSEASVHQYQSLDKKTADNDGSNLDPLSENPLPAPNQDVRLVKESCIPHNEKQQGQGAEN